MRNTLKTLLCLLLTLMLMAPALAEDTLELPANTVVVEQEAFYQIGAHTVVVPEGVETIGTRAFANSEVHTVYLPSSLSQMADDAFDGCDDLMAMVPVDSYALQWCIDNSVPYTVLGQVDDTLPVVYDTDYTGWELAVGDGLELTVLTSTTAEWVAIYDEQGSELIRVDESMYDDFNLSFWNLEVELTQAGSYPLFLRAGNAAGESEDFVLNIVVGDTLHMAMKAWVEAEFETPLRVGEPVCIGVEISGDAEASLAGVRLVDADDDTVLDEWDVTVDDLTDDYEYVDRSFFADVTFEDAGVKHVFFQARDGNGAYDIGTNVLTLDVRDRAALTTVRCEQNRNNVGVVGEPFWFVTGMTPGSVAVGLFDEDNTLLNVWTQNDSFSSYDDDEEYGDEDDYGDEGGDDYGDEGGDDYGDEGGDDYFPMGVGLFVWAFDEPGTHTVTFKASDDGEDWSDPGASITVTVSELPMIYEIRNSSDEYALAVSGNEAEINVTTSVSAQFLRLYDEYNEPVETWTADEAVGYADPSEVGWDVTVEFGDANWKTFTFRVSADGEEYTGAASITLVKAASSGIDSIEINDYELAGPGAMAGFTVYTDTSQSISCVELLDFDGTVLDTSYEPSEDDEYMLWLLEAPVSHPGENLIFAHASADGTNFGPLFGTTFYVDMQQGGDAYADDIIEGIDCSVTGDTVTFTVYTTGAEFQCLRLTSLADGTSEIIPFVDLEPHQETDPDEGMEGDVYYTFTRSFPGTGSYWMKLEASPDGAQYDRGRHVEVELLGNDLANINSVYAAEDLFGSLRVGHGTAYGEFDIDYPLSRVENKAYLTPANGEDEIRLFGRLGTGSVEQLQLCGDTAYTLYGIGIGMNADQVLNACSEFNLRPMLLHDGADGYLEAIPNGDTWLFSPVDSIGRFDYVIVERDQGGYVSSITAVSEIGE